MKKLILLSIIILIFDFCFCQSSDKCGNGVTMQDYYNSEYNTVQIGKQCWMKENLKYDTIYYDGSFVYLDNINQYINKKGKLKIPSGTNISEISLKNYKQNYNDCDTFYISNDSLFFGYMKYKKSKIGNLYDWETASQICPKGWHLPSDDDWKELEKFIGMSDDELDKKTNRGPGLVTSLRTGGLTGFDMEFEKKSGLEQAIYWTSSAHKDKSNKYQQDIYYVRHFMGGKINSNARTGHFKSGFNCVRCLRD